MGDDAPQHIHSIDAMAQELHRNVPHFAVAENPQRQCWAEGVVIRNHALGARDLRVAQRFFAETRGFVNTHRAAFEFDHGVRPVLVDELRIRSIALHRCGDARGFAVRVEADLRQPVGAHVHAQARIRREFRDRAI